jgi:hypothetical protein
MTNVRVDLKALITLPRRPSESAGAGRTELLAVARQLVQALFEVLAQLTDRRRPTAVERVEHERGAEMHQRAVIGLLELQERSVERVSRSLPGIAAPRLASWVTVWAAPPAGIGG